MRVLHVPYSFFPDPAGGTEVYVECLAVCQRLLGYESAVAAPATIAAKYDHSGFPVWRFPVSPNLTLRELYGEGDEVAAKAFGRILDQFAPDVVHLHAFTSAVSSRLADQAVSRAIPTVLNYHTPTVSCLRGTLLRWGSEVCDGRLDANRCAACKLHAHGMARPIASVIASLPLNIGQSLGKAGLEGGVWTALRMAELTDLRIGAFRRLLRSVEQVIAPCDWVKRLLVQNGVLEEKITLCRQGIAWQSNHPWLDPPQSTLQLPVRAAFMGRLDWTKGAHVAVQALRSAPELPVQLDLFGVSQGDAGNRYATELRAMMADDERIRLLAPIPSIEVIPRLREYDVVIVPSQLLETGPLVVLEAFAAGTPVIGSNLGGIGELVRDGVDGILVQQASSPVAWLDSLQRVCSDPGLLFSLRAGIRPPRHAKQSALDTVAVYARALRRMAVIPANASS